MRLGEERVDGLQRLQSFLSVLFPAYVKWPASITALGHRGRAHLSRSHRLSLCLTIDSPFLFLLVYLPLLSKTPSSLRRSPTFTQAPTHIYAHAHPLLSSEVVCCCNSESCVMISYMGIPNPFLLFIPNTKYNRYVQQQQLTRRLYCIHFKRRSRKRHHSYSYLNGISRVQVLRTILLQPSSPLLRVRVRISYSVHTRRGTRVSLRGIGSASSTSTNTPTCSKKPLQRSSPCCVAFPLLLFLLSFPSSSSSSSSSSIVSAPFSRHRNSCTGRVRVPYLTYLVLYCTSHHSVSPVSFIFQSQPPTTPPLAPPLSYWNVTAAPIHCRDSSL
ncbi:hypothetical protein HDV57DRAFT_126610 [Trichoderma longibrachiatum]